MYTRINKIPAMFSEVSKDFGVLPKKVMQAMSETDQYIPALGPKEYIERISKHLKLPDRIMETAIDLINPYEEGSPTIRACCAVIKATNKSGLKIKACDIASILDVTAGINVALKRAKIG